MITNCNLTCNRAPFLLQIMSLISHQWYNKVVLNLESTPSVCTTDKSVLVQVPGVHWPVDSVWKSKRGHCGDGRKGCWHFCYNYYSHYYYYYPPKTACGCLHGGVTENGRTRNPLTTWTVHVLVHVCAGMDGCTYWVTLRVFEDVVVVVDLI